MSEKNTFNPESKRDREALKELGAERHEQLREQLERAGEVSREKVDDARHEALEKATSREKLEQDPIKAERQPSPAERRSGPISKREREASFKATMKEVQGQMTGPSRAFSKVIHNKTVERVSEVTGNTIARPDAVLSGAIFAFIMTLGVYILSKNLGYPLSGFETIGAFILGWIIGLVFDFLRVMITGRK